MKGVWEKFMCSLILKHVCREWDKTCVPRVWQNMCAESVTKACLLRVWQKLVCWECDQTCVPRLWLKIVCWQCDKSLCAESVTKLVCREFNKSLCAENVTQKLVCQVWERGEVCPAADCSVPVLKHQRKCPDKERGNQQRSGLIFRHEQGRKIVSNF